MSTRTAVLAAAVLLVGLTACAGPGRAAPPAGSVTGSATRIFPAGDEIPEQIRVRNPRDARGIRGCALLTRAQLVELGLLPDTAQEQPAASDDLAGCTWTLAADPTNKGGVGVRTDSEHPALLGIYRLRNTMSSFEPLEIAGHPAVAGQRSPEEGCTVDVGVADDQLLSAGGNVAGRRIADPCGLSRRIAEAVLSNLPPMH